MRARLPRNPTCGGRARRLVEQHVAGQIDAEMMDDLRLVVSELVDNAYLHGRGVIQLTVELGDDRVRVEVTDQGEGAAIKIRERGADELSGYGLRLVDQVADAWGAYEGTTHVWADVRKAD
jgi:anti-sigma regulatory factor (Ser/Thr protein kinase)